MKDESKPLLGKSLGVLLSIHPQDTLTGKAIRIMEAALFQGAGVYVYLSDEAVLGTHLQIWRNLQSSGLKLFVCALSARNRGLELDQDAVYSGLGQLNEIMVRSDRFFSFN